MALKTITVNFTPCIPSPENGYNIQYREFGSLGGYIDAGNFPASPAVIIFMSDNLVETYEGIIRSDCGDGVIGNPINFIT